ncbi:hypothetical protein BSG1_15890 [Bacillus sp. SG-1]|nr:hypothetical protein BSG1_15890 [Bacillus sp. SG-1]
MGAGMLVVLFCLSVFTCFLLQKKRKRPGQSSTSKWWNPHRRESAGLKWRNDKVEFKKKRFGPVKVTLR